MTNNIELRVAMTSIYPFGIHHTDHDLRPSAAWTYSWREGLYETLLLGVSAGSWTVWYPDDSSCGVLLDGRQRYAATRLLFGLPTDQGQAMADGTDHFKVQFNLFTRRFREVPAHIPSTDFDPPSDPRHHWIDTARVLPLSGHQFWEGYLVRFGGQARGPALLDALRSVQALRSIGRVHQLVAYTRADVDQARWLATVFNVRPRRTFPTAG